MKLVFRVPSFLRQSRHQACVRKVRYGHLATALRACEQMSLKGIAGLTAYQCPKCEGFHIGHEPGASLVITVGASTIEAG